MDLEIIIVDDCSTDSSWEIVNGIKNEDCRIKALRHDKNGGPAASRNTILEHATGEFVAFFDDDDESAPDRIRIQYEALIAYKATHGIELVACYASGIRCYSNGYNLDIQAIGSMPKIPKGEEVADYLLFNGRKGGVFYGGGTPTCALMAKLSTFRAIGSFDSSLRRVEDVDFAIRLALAGGHFIGCPDNLYKQTATIADDKTPCKNFEAELHLINKYSDYLGTKRRYNYARLWFKIRYLHFGGKKISFMALLICFLCIYPISGVRHLLRSGPSRLSHERSMNRDRKN